MVSAFVATSASAQNRLAVAHDRDAPASRGNLVNVGRDLREEISRGDKRDDGHVLVDERDGAVLEFARGKALRVDVGYLLQLERAFHRKRIQVAAANEDGARASPNKSAISMMAASLWSTAEISAGVRARSSWKRLAAARCPR